MAEPSDSRCRVVTDHLGSPRLVVNTADGTVAQRMDYDEWGNVLADSQPGFQPFGYAGGLYDRDLGLVRFGTRDYEAGTGRWTRQEPLAKNPRMVVAYARKGIPMPSYAYAANNPVRYVDRNGLFVGVDDAAELGIAIIVGEALVATGVIAAGTYCIGTSCLGDITLWFNKKDKCSSPNQMDREVKRKQAPKEVDRVDRAHPPEDPQDHTHLEDGTRIRKDGTTDPPDANIPSSVRDWLRGHGWPF